jgi:internalin A
MSQSVPSAEQATLEAIRRIEECRCGGRADLDLSGLALVELPLGISLLGELTQLDISRTAVSDLSPVASLSALKSLDCSGTQIIELSPLYSLSSLQSLECAGTQLADLSPLASISALKSLDCSFTKVADLSPLATLSSLRSLNCSYTQVTDLSPLASLSTLQVLECRRTQVADLSPLANLSALQSLDCSSTLVANVSSLRQLTRLHDLRVADLNISDFPESLLDSPALGRLILKGSKLEGVPAELLGGDNCLERLRSHFRDLKEGLEELSDVKVLVLGNGRIGKTQLCGQLKGDAYENEAESTHGILVSSAALGANRLHLWDFGGQELYHGTHSLFMRTRAVFVVLWTPDSENQQEHEWNGMTFRNHRLDYWLELVATLGGKDCPLLVLQCRCDTPEVELITPPVADELLNRFSFRKVLHQSSATPRGLDSVKVAITDAISWMLEKQGVERIGSGRLRVKRRLEALRDADATLPVAARQHRLVSQTFFRAVCEEEGGVSSPDQLLHYLHEYGVVFHRPGLFGDQIILDQGWALEAIYTVFNREKCWRQIRSLGGRFTRALLHALTWQKHTEEEQKLFLSMMLSCGICFIHRELEDGEKEYIAPDLLPPEEEMIELVGLRWGDDGADQSWTYEIPHEHPGLMTAVISTIGAMAGIDAVYWKGGFCGYEKNTRSRVRVRNLSPGDELRIEVETKGGDARGLIAAIDKALERTLYHTGCRSWGRMRESELLLQVKKGKAIAREDKAEEADIPVVLDFTEPPRPGTTYAVSYAWTDESSDLVDELCEKAEAKGITILRDKSAVGLGERLAKFMRSLAAHDRVFVILSRKYLESPYCMFELLEIWRLCKQDDAESLNKVRCFAVPDAVFSSPLQRTQRAVYWKQEFEGLDALVKAHGADLLGIEDFRSYKLMQDFAHRVGDILYLVADTLQPRTIDDLLDFGPRED